MKVLGLLGGMSWESTIPYYRTINEQVKARLGGLHSAKSCSTASIFRRLNACSTRAIGAAPAGCWPPPQWLCAAGAEAIVICTNTMHKVAEAVEQASGLPLIHIADATALQVREKTFAASGCWARALPWSRPSIAAACRNCTASTW